MKSPGEENLERIPRAAGSTTGRPVAARAEEYPAMARECRQPGPLPLEARLSLFTERPMDSGVVYCCAEAALPETISRAMAARGKRRLAIPRNFPRDWLPATLVFLRDEDPRDSELDRSEGSWRGCTAAIALPGSEPLGHAAHEGRRVLSDPRLSPLRQRVRGPRSMDVILVVNP